MNRNNLPQLRNIKLPQLNTGTLWIGVFLLLVGYWIVVNLAL